MVREQATIAIRDAYTRIGRSGFEKPYIEILSHLTDVPRNEQTESMHRVVAATFKIPIENIKTCRAQIGNQDSYIAVQIAKSKNGDIGYAVHNFGVPGLTGATGWLSALP